MVSLFLYQKCQAENPVIKFIFHTPNAASDDEFPEHVVRSYGNTLSWQCVLTDKDCAVQSIMFYS